MKIYFSLFFLLTIPFLAANKKYKALFCLIIFSALCSEFQISLPAGSRLTVGSYVALCVFPFIFPFFITSLFKKDFSLIRILFLEWGLIVVLGIIFIFLFPPEGFNTKMLWRGFMGTIRILSDALIAVFIIFLFKKKKIDIKYVIKVIFLVASIQLVFVLIEFFFDFRAKSFFVEHIRLLRRPTGLCYEPKSLGRLSFGAFLIIFSLFLGKAKNVRIRYKYLFVFLLTIALAQSLSTFLAGGLTIVFTLIFFSYKIKQLVVNVGFGLVVIICGYLITFNPNFKLLQNKVNWVLHLAEIDQSEGEPLIFVYVDHADRYVLNFFYNNPQYLLFGTGPNLIIFFSQKYVSSYLKSWWIGTFDVMPTTIIYYLSRSGLFGIILYARIFFALKKKIKKIKYLPFNYLLLSSFIFASINNQIWLYINLAIIYGALYYQPNSLKSILKKKSNVIRL